MGIAHPKTLLLPILQHLPYARPTKQANRTRNERQNYNLVLPAIPLKTRRKNILILDFVTYRQSLVLAELFIACRTSRGGSADLEVRGGWLGCLERDDGAVGEAGAFAE